MIKVLLVDDEPLLTESLEIILSMDSDLSISARADNGVEACAVLEKTEVDLILLDLNMPKMGGLDFISFVRENYPNIKILVLTTFYDEINVKEALKRGADGYLLKDSGKEIIINGIKNVANGQGILDSKVMNQLSKIMISDTKDDGILKEVYCEREECISNKLEHKNLELLTKREKEILSMVAEGYANKQIAELLFISEGTVKNYISSIYDKLGVHDRIKLALMVTE